MAKLSEPYSKNLPNNIARTDVKGVIESLAEKGYKRTQENGAFFVPGFAKFVVVKKPAKKAGKGINPFTKDQQYSRRIWLGRSSGLGR